jgi:hypothetical protein
MKTKWCDLLHSPIAATTNEATLLEISKPEVWRKREGWDIGRHEKEKLVFHTQYQRDKDGNLVHVEDWIGLKPRWWPKYAPNEAAARGLVSNIYAALSGNY